MLVSLKYGFEIKNVRCFCSQVRQKNKIYSKTVVLPQTSLPLHLNKEKLKDRDSSLSNSDEFKRLYEWQRKTLLDPEFVLHDGPPYANGSTHMGHAINKILKDIIVRTKIVEGKKVNYIPGWDCHGLPIELKAVTDTKEKLTPMQIRHKAKKFAKTTIETQKVSFQSWGVTGDWNNAYTTYSTSYIKNQLKQFYNLFKQNLVYRDVKPVYWSPSSRTALAEAELEYNEEHKSKAATVKFKVKKVPPMLEPYKSNLYALIWTTTPWTLPSNQAIAFNPDLQYSIVKNKITDDLYLVATDLIETLSKNLHTDLEHTVHCVPSSLLHEISYIHPIYKEIICPLLASRHATATKGTGLVHTAPAHGPDDFLIALNNKIPVKSIVNEEGCYIAEAGENLKNLFVLNEGNDKVLDVIKEDVLLLEDFVHSYPYDWRTKKPIILRASEQWFLNTDKIKNRCVELLEQVQFIPKNNSDMHKKNLVNQIVKRPYWCISRQRTWGVPIPVFYEKSSGKPILNEKIIEHFCQLLEKHGSDFWWTLPKTEIIPSEILKNLNLTINDLEQGKDILDIWFDSGISWSSVLPEPQIADFYLEGVDQCTGWFQSSLLTSVALRDKAPYKNLYVHGFVVDENGLKMSKSLGNVIDPIDIIKGSKSKKSYGVDTLRWWVACHANQDSMTYIGENVLQSSSDDVQKIRSILRFSIGALKDYNEIVIPYSQLQLIDKYILHLLSKFNSQVTAYYDDYQLNKICVSVINLLTNPISALYYTAIKDRLYCDSVNSKSRRSAQFVLNQIFHAVMKSIAPIIPHLAQEMYEHLPVQKPSTSFFESIQKYKLDEIWENDDLNHLLEIVLKMKREVNRELGASTNNAVVELQISEKLNSDFLVFSNEISNVEDELCDIFQVSEVKIIVNKKVHMLQFYNMNLTTSKLFSCNRCRRVSAVVENELCHRCNQVIGELNDVKETVASN